MKSRALRRHNNARVIKNRVSLVKQDLSNYKVDSRGTSFVGQLKKAPGRVRKKHPFDCGNPKCGLCHSSKIAGDVKISDKRKLTPLEIERFYGV